MSIDDMVVRDPRITKLASLVGWSRRETVGCLVLDVWPICYDQREHIIAADLINIAAGNDGFADAMVRAGLAEWVRGNRKVRIKGAQERIEYLERKREAGRVGGVNSGKSRRQNSSTDHDGAQAPGNPPSPPSVPVPPSAPSPVLVPVQEKEQSAPPAAVLAGFKLEVDKQVRRRAKERPTATAEESATVTRVLQKLGERTGCGYTGSRAHTDLIVARLRDGFTEEDLRRVIAYCAESLEWGEPGHKLNHCLRPETLFGPETIERYVYKAREYRKHESVKAEVAHG
jgi:uncharacterized phage protein (TIGR02220 family)